MHERDALTKRSVKHSLALFYFHLDAHRLEPNLVNLRFRHHLGLVVFVIGQRGRSGMPPSGNAPRPSTPPPAVLSNDNDCSCTPSHNRPPPPPPQSPTPPP